jgi:hypothetical protein
MTSKNSPIVPVVINTPAVETVTINTPPAVTVNSTPKTDTAPPVVRPQSRPVAMALSLIARNQQQTQALQTTVSQAAISEAANAATTAQEQAMAVSSSSASMSQQTVNTLMPVNNAPVTDTKSSVSTSNSSSLTVTSISPPKVVTSTTPNVSSTASANMTNVEPQQASTPVVQSYFVKPQPTSTAQPVQNTVSSTPPTNNSNRVIAVTQPTITIAVPTANTAVFSQKESDNQQAAVFTAYIQPQTSMFYSMVSNMPVEQQQQAVIQPVSFARQAEIEQVNNSSSFMTNRTDPLNDIIEQKLSVSTTNNTEQTQTVKSNVAANELAGGVDISKLAKMPVGYNNYTNLVLKDGKMYEPKEIYKNQTPVDNARALRQLSTDRLHQQMIDQQYRR